MGLLRSFGFLACVAVCSAGAGSAFATDAYAPPAASAALLRDLDFGRLPEQPEAFAAYRAAMLACDATDEFEGHSVKLPGDDDYLCSRDASGLQALLKVQGGGVYWHSKMALDVDGSWAAYNVPGHTDTQTTAVQWPNGADPNSMAAQINPDKYPYIVIPGGVPNVFDTSIDAPERKRLAREFRSMSGVNVWDFAVVVYGSRWTPAIVADTGPFMRIGEASSRVFEALGHSRCKGWDASHTYCVGAQTGKYPYINKGLPDANALYIVWPGSRDFALREGNAMARMCAFARRKLPGLPKNEVCP